MFFILIHIFFNVIIVIMIFVFNIIGNGCLQKIMRFVCLVLFIGIGYFLGKFIVNILNLNVKNLGDLLVV